MTPEQIIDTWERAFREAARVNATPVSDPEPFVPRPVVAEKTS